MAREVLFTVVLLFAFQQLAASQDAKPTATPTAKPTTKPGCQECQMEGCGIPGVPGSSGVPGIPGTHGSPGAKGVRGPEGKPGPKGESGMPGIDGIPGRKGMQGDPGEYGNPGEPGAPGPKGIAGFSGPIAAANWKQCVWKDMNDGKDSGKVVHCRFTKLQSRTALKVSFQGNMRSIRFDDARCSRWYFKFNGKECTGPMTIEAVVYSQYSVGKETNVLHHRSFEGYCENLPRGAVNVELWVGACRGQSQGDAFTGWNSVSRIMVEEVPRSQ